MEPLQRKNVLCKMILSLILTQRGTSLFTSTWRQHKRTSDIFCICQEWFSNVIFGKEIATGFGHGLVHKIGLDCF